MSIITDALKKAEQERELRSKRAVEVLTEVPEESKPVEMLLGQSEVVETEIEENAGLTAEAAEQNAIYRAEQAFPQQIRGILLIAGSVFVCFLALVLLTWSGGGGAGFSAIWRPFRNASAFQVPPMYQQNILSVRAHNFSVSGVKLPFNLSGISSQGDARYAIINDVIVQKGDSIDGATVKEILGREVVLETRAGEIKLKIQT